MIKCPNKRVRKHFLGVRGPVLPLTALRRAFPDIRNVSSLVLRASLVIYGGASPRTLETEEPFFVSRRQRDATPIQSWPGAYY